jgi:hypothetical protein
MRATYDKLNFIRKYMDVTEAVVAIVGLGMVITAILGLIGLINPKWLGIQTRGRSSAVFFGISFACLVVGIAFSSGTSQEENSKLTSKITESNVAVQVDDKVPDKSALNSKEYEDLASLLIEFDRLTEIQKEEWNNSNQWKRWVDGQCIVSEVESTSMLSEISEADYEVSCEFANQDRAIVFYSKDMRNQVISLEKGDVIEFKGRLKSIRDWGFWRSGYVKVE